MHEIFSAQKKTRQKQLWVEKQFQFADKKFNPQTNAFVVSIIASTTISSANFSDLFKNDVK